MKKQLHIIICSIVLIFTFGSCKRSFLELVPVGSQIAKTTDDYNLLMNGNTLYSYTGNSGWQIPLPMGDEVDAEAAYFPATPIQTPRAFRWEPLIYDATQFSLDITLYMQNLYLCNKVINEVGASTGGTEQQKNVIKAEAQATRAWVYFQLINFYAKPYNPATAAQDPGFPIIKIADISQNSFARNSVQEVYDFIIADLNAAISVLPVNAVIKTRMSKPAAEGLLGKVYVFMGKNSQALPLFNASIQEITSTAYARFYDYNVEFAPGGSFLPINTLTGPNGPSNNFDNLTESVVGKNFASGLYNGYFQTNGLVLTAATAGLYSPTDLRLKFYTNTNPSGGVNPSGRLRKYGVSYTRFGLELADLYLLSAECKARLNNLTDAKADIETLRKNRISGTDYLVPAAVAADQQIFIKFIIDERVREYAVQGYRWFDMRRLSVDPLFAGKTFTHNLYNTDGSTTVFTLKQPERLVLKFPQTFIDANPGITDNP